MLFFTFHVHSLFLSRRAAVRSPKKEQRLEFPGTPHACEHFTTGTGVVSCSWMGAKPPT